MYKYLLRLAHTRTASQKVVKLMKARRRELERLREAVRVTYSVLAHPSLVFTCIYSYTMHTPSFVFSCMRRTNKTIVLTMNTIFLTHTNFKAAQKEKKPEKKPAPAPAPAPAPLPSVEVHFVSRGATFCTYTLYGHNISPFPSHL